MRIALCADETLCRVQVAQYIKEYITQRAWYLDLSVYQRGSDLLEAVRHTGSFELYILDIQMPRLSGIDLGIQLRNLDTDSRIFFLSSGPDQAIAAFRAKASEYFLKPVKKAELFAALDDAISLMSDKREKGMVVKTLHSSIRLSFDTILYAELKTKNIHYHLTNGKTVESLSIRTSFSGAVQHMLRDSRFFLCSTSMAVNLYHVQAVSSDTLTFRNGESIYLSKRASRELRAVWTDFWMNKDGGN